METLLIPLQAALSVVLFFSLLILFLCVGFSLIVGGPQLGSRTGKYIIGQYTRLARFALRQTLRLIRSFFREGWRVLHPILTRLLYHMRPRP